ncbi:MAG: radical SAM protein [Cetobacterium sp.]
MRTTNMIIKINNFCNINCSYCMNHGLEKNEKSSISESTILDIASFLRREKIEISNMSILGGEPTLVSPEIIEKIIKEINPKTIDMFTNGVEIKKEIMDVVLKSKISLIMSVDSGGSGKTISVLKSFIDKYKYTPIVSATITIQNHDTYPEFVLSLDSIGIKKLNTQIDINMNNDEHIPLVAKSLAKSFSLATRMKHGIKNDTLKMLTKKRTAKNNVNIGIVDEIVLDLEGNICQSYVTIYNKIGNVKYSKMKDVLESEKQHEETFFRSLLKTGDYTLDLLNKEMSGGFFYDRVRRGEVLDEPAFAIKLMNEALLFYLEDFYTKDGDLIK